MNNNIKKILASSTLSEMFQTRVQLSPKETAYHYFANDQWQDKTWEGIAEDSVVWQQIFKKLGLQTNDKVSIMLKNCHEWVAFDQAALGLGLVTVPLFFNDNADNASYILQESESKLLFIGDNTICRQLLEKTRELNDLQHIITLNKLECNDARVHSLDDIWHIAEDNLPQDLVSDANQLTTIVYTSGTTGRPKGVMLSHKNILSNAKSILGCADFLSRQHSFLSFLPLSHMLERTGGYYFPMLIGATIAYARSIPQLAEDLVTIKPSVLVSVPRIYERIYANLHEELSQNPRSNHNFFNLTTTTGLP